MILQDPKDEEFTSMQELQDTETIHQQTVDNIQKIENHIRLKKRKGQVELEKGMIVRLPIQNKKNSSSLTVPYPYVARLVSSTKNGGAWKVEWLSTKGWWSEVKGDILARYMCQVS